MLGYRFSPRFKDLQDQRFRKAHMPDAEAAGGYGPLEAPARNRVNVKKVITAWPDMLRVAGFLVTRSMSGPTICCGCSAARATRSRWGRRSPSTGGQPRPSTSWRW
ncbi:Tn3 family transposase [Streptomyces sp. NBC_00151]|uniref:Tn3 family transposase n=1 Tax=Streptomyces sp. NBC_00151 TaxID=2975669 RepID=UPI003FA36B03